LIYRPEALAAMHSRDENPIAVSVSNSATKEKPDAAQEARSERRPLFGGGFLAHRDTPPSPAPTHEPAAESDQQPARQFAGAPTPTTSPPQAPGREAVLASFRDSSHPANVANSRQALHVAEPPSSRTVSPATASIRSDIAKEYSPSSNFDRSQMGAAAASPRLPSLNLRQPASVSNGKSEREVVPQDVPMHGPPAAQQSSRRTHSQEKNPSPSPLATSPAEGASAMSPWQQPTWTGGATGTLQVPYNGQSPQAISNPIANGGIFGANPSVTGAQPN
jgi:hypothetical protein